MTGASSRYSARWWLRRGNSAAAVDTPPADRRPRRAWEALVPLVVLVLRLAFATRQPPYLDWMVVLSVYWVLHVFLSRSRAMTAITAATMVALFAIYLSRELPLVLDTLRLCR